MPSKSPSLTSLRAKARKLLAELKECGAAMDANLKRGMWRSYNLGKVLITIKGAVGNGNFDDWIKGNIPNATNPQRHIELAKMNPDARKVRDLSPDSFRQFVFGFIVPEKFRPLIQGDLALKRETHHLTLRNFFTKLMRRVEIGAVTIDAEEARKDLAPLFDWLCRIEGLDPDRARAIARTGSPRTTPHPPPVRRLPQTPPPRSGSIDPLP